MKRDGSGVWRTSIIRRLGHTTRTTAILLLVPDTTFCKKNYTKVCL